MSDERSRYARAGLGLTRTLALRLHPDLAEFVATEAAANYCSQQEYVRRLIVDAKRAEEMTR